MHGFSLCQKAASKVGNKFRPRSSLTRYMYMALELGKRRQCERLCQGIYCLVGSLA